MKYTKAETKIVADFEKLIKKKDGNLWKQKV